jgi:hypothetical protein
MRDFRDAKAMAQTLREARQDAASLETGDVVARLRTILGWMREGSPAKTG